MRSWSFCPTLYFEECMLKSTVYGSQSTLHAQIIKNQVTQLKIRIASLRIAKVFFETIANRTCFPICVMTQYLFYLSSNEFSHEYAQRYISRRYLFIFFSFRYTNIICIKTLQPKNELFFFLSQKLEKFCFCSPFIINSRVRNWNLASRGHLKVFSLGKSLAAANS